MPHDRKSQSALEYMMTYGWAILIIVIVAGVLYSLGVFSPSNSASTTVTGFFGFNVQAACIQGGALELQIANGLGYTVNITRLNTTGSNGQSVSILTTLMIAPSQSQSAFIPGACTTTVGSSFSNSVIVTYTEPGQVFSGPYYTTGKLSGKSILIKPSFVASFGGTSSSNINSIADSKFPAGSSALAIVAWVRTTQSITYPFVFDYGAYANSYENGILGVYSGVPTGDFWGNHFPASGSANDGNWHLLVFTYPGGTEPVKTYVYIDGVVTKNINNITSNIQVGAGTNAYIGYGTTNFFLGDIADVQLYSINLTSSQVNALYSEGIGGAPLSNAGLVGWWPLDGNANDYSGNNNNGVATSVNWVSP